MSRLRISLLSLATVCAVGMSMAAIASAANPAWKVNGSKLGAQVKKQAKITSGETTLIGKASGFPAEIKCTTAVVANAYIEGNGESAGQDGTTGITFSNCTVVKPNKCLVTQPIVTKQLNSHLVRFGPGQGKIGDLFEPSQGTEFASLEFTDLSTSELCSIKGGNPFPVKGTVVAEIRAKSQVQGQEPLESKIGELIFPSQAIEKVNSEGAEREVKLQLGAEKAAFIGKFEAQLVSGEPFGVF